MSTEQHFEQWTTTVEIDGNTYDRETGELLIASGRKSDWVPQDSADFEWLGDRMGEADAEIAAIEERRKFYNENFDAMVRDVKRKKDGLLYKFGRMIEDFARANLPKGKKTWTCPTMSVAFRTNPARVAVKDDEVALGWARNNAPDAVQILEKFYVSKLPAEVKADLLAHPESAIGTGLEVTAASERTEIKTSSSGQ